MEAMDPREIARQAGHVVLDGVTAFDIEETRAMEAAFGKLLEIGAIEVRVDEAAEELELDISPLLSGTMLVVRELVDELARRDGVDHEDVLATIRTRLDAR